MENIRVYIYTAVNGYAWQGCGAALSSSLMSCVDSLGLFDAPGGAEPPLGAIVRWKVAGENGTAVLRAHIRKAGDFRGRDSRYIALAFLPFRITRAHPADYRRFWNHPLLASPQPDPLDGLGLDYAAEFWLPSGETWVDSFWTEDVSRTCPPNGGDGVLRDLSILFQSSATELGALTAVIRGDGSEGLSARLSYKVFSEVSEERRAAKAYMELQGGDAQIGSAHSARSAWRQALDGLSERVGRMPDFGGLADYARNERQVFSSTEAGFEENRDLASGAEDFWQSCAALRGTLDGSEVQDGVIRQHEVRHRALTDKVRAADCLEKNAILRRLEDAGRLLAKARSIQAEAARFAECTRQSFTDDADCASRCRNAFRALRAMPEADWLSSSWLDSWEAEIRRVEKLVRETSRSRRDSSSKRSAQASSPGDGSAAAHGGGRRKRSRASRIFCWVVWGLVIILAIVYAVIESSVIKSAVSEVLGIGDSGAANPSGERELKADRLLPKEQIQRDCPDCKGKKRRPKSPCDTCQGSGRVEITVVRVRPVKSANRDAETAAASSTNKSDRVSGGTTSTNKSDRVSGGTTSPDKSDRVSGGMTSPDKFDRVSGGTTSTNKPDHVSGGTISTNGLDQVSDETSSTNTVQKATQQSSGRSGHGGH